MRALLLWLLTAIAGLLYGLRHLNMEVDILSVLPKGVREVEALREMRTHFQARNELLLVIEGRDSEQADDLVEKTRDTLVALPSVKHAETLGGPQDSAQAGALLAWVLQNSAPERLREIAARLDEGRVAAHLAGVVETLATSPDAARVQRLSYDPLGLTDILSAQDLAGALDADEAAMTGFEKLRVVRVLPRAEMANYKDAVAFVDVIRAALPSSAGTPAPLLTGEIAFMAEAGGGLERDLSSTIGGSVLLIVLLFWIMYRRIAPLFWIMTLLAISLGITIGIGSLFLGTINAMNLGFAAIVLGLVVDYGVLIYEERRAGDSGAMLRGRVMRGILGGAGTTAAVFLMLLFSRFPGLRDLGVLVAIGVLAGAVVMVTTLPALLEKTGLSQHIAHAAPASTSRDRSAFLWTLAPVTAAVVILLWLGPPGFDGSSAPLRLRYSEAAAALEKLTGAGGESADQTTAPLLVTAENTSSLRSRAARLANTPGVWLPLPFLPDAEAQHANRPVIASLVAAQDRLQRALEAAGFTTDSLALFRAMIAACEPFVKTTTPLAITDSPAADILSRFVSDRPDSNSAALLGKQNTSTLSASAEGVFTPAWERLGPALSEIAMGDALFRMLPLSLAILAVLYVVMRNMRDTLLALTALGTGFLLWFALMSLLGQTWNLASIAAIPLMIGTGEDYGIHMLVALQKENGNVRRVRATTGRAVIFCALSSCIGFGSLALAGNGAIASLGVACAAGLSMSMIVAVWLLPEWRARWVK